MIFAIPTLKQVTSGNKKQQIAKLVLDKNNLHSTDLETLQNLTFETERTWRDTWKK